MVSRRTFMFILALAASMSAASPAFAKDGDSGDGGGGGDGGSDGGGGGDGGSDSDSGGDGGSDSDSGGDGGNKSGKNGSDASDEERIRKAVSRGDAEKLRDILQSVGRKHPGEVLRIRLKGSGKSLRYRMRILQPDGRRVDLEVDARTGNIIKTDGE